MAISRGPGSGGSDGDGGGSGDNNDSFADKEAVRRLKQQQDQQQGTSDGGSGDGGSGLSDEEAVNRKKKETFRSGKTTDQPLDTSGGQTSQQDQQQDSQDSFSAGGSQSQGIESGGGPVSVLADQFETKVAHEADLGKADIAIQKTRKDGEIVFTPELTESGREKIRDRQQRGKIAARNKARAAGSLREDFSRADITDLSTPTRKKIQAAKATPEARAGGRGAPLESPASTGGDVVGVSGEQQPNESFGQQTDTGGPQQLPDGERQGIIEGNVAGVAAGLDELSRVDETVNRVLEESANRVTPHARMTLGGAGLQARAKKEERLAKRAERGAEKLARGDVPTAGEAGAILFQSAEVAERGFTETGRAIEEANPARGMGPSIGGESLGSVPGNLVSGLVGGVGMGVGAAGQAVPSVTTDVTSEGKSPSQLTGNVGMLKNLGASQVEMFANRPVSTSLLLAAPAVDAAPAFVRGYRATSRARATVPESAITGDQVSPQFKTSSRAPTQRAVGEVRSRAQSQPEAVTEILGSDSALYHSTSTNFGRSLTVAEGASELPGLFVSPDASLIGLRNTKLRSTFREKLPSLEDVKPTKPNVRTKPDRFAGFEGDQISAMPEYAKGAGYEVRGPKGSVIERGLGRGQAKAKASQIEGAQVAPDASTSGYRFLTEEAKPGKAYVRPKGSRTSELEAVFGPESQFSKAGRVAVEMESGQKLPLDLYRRVGESQAGEATTGAAEGTMSAPGIESTYTPVSELGSSPGISATSYMTAVGGAGMAATTFVESQSPSDPLGNRSSTGFGEFVDPTGSSPIGSDVGSGSTSASGRIEESTARTISTPRSEPPTTQRSPIGSGSGTGSVSPTGGPTSVGISPPTMPRTGGPTAPPSGPPSSPPSRPPSSPPPGEPSSPLRPPTTAPPEPPIIRARGDDDDKKDEKYTDLIAGVRRPDYTDFVDPLTGKVLETEKYNTAPTIPGV